MIGIYKIISPNNRIYVGQSVNIEKRFKEYKSNNVKTKRQPKLWRSFEKYGVDNHIFQVIEICQYIELTEREGYYQDKYNSINEGLNCIRVSTNDNTGYVSDETKEKIRKSLTGFKQSKEQCEKKSKQMIGNKYRLNKPKEECEKLKISKTMKSKKINVGNKNPMWGKTGEDNPGSKIIINYNTGVFYFGSKEASESSNISYSTMKRYICNEKINKTSFRYC